MDATILETILANKSYLLKNIPHSQYDTISYDFLKRKSFEFYEVYRSLSETLSDSKKRAKKMGFDFNLDVKDLIKIYFDQGGRCHESSLPLDYKTGTPEMKNPCKASIDRIDNHKGYVKGNVQLLCHFVNNAKSTYPKEIYENFIILWACQLNRKIDNI
jgi:hypothetical protein